jgi:opacity protein-like surface antigen
MSLMRRFLGALCACIFVVAAAAAAAEEAAVADVDYTRTGPYVSVGGAYAINAYRGLPDFDDTWAVNGRIGYRVTRHWALEFEFEYAHEFTSKSAPIHNSYYVPGVNVKYYFLEDRFQPYILGGVNFAVSKANGELNSRHSARGADWSFRMGGGLNIFATEKIAFYVEGTYLWGVGDLWNLDYAPVGAGIEYHF